MYVQWYGWSDKRQFLVLCRVGRKSGRRRTRGSPERIPRGRKRRSSSSCRSTSTEGRTSRPFRFTSELSICEVTRAINYASPLPSIVFFDPLKNVFLTATRRFVNKVEQSRAFLFRWAITWKFWVFHHQRHLRTSVVIWAVLGIPARC